MYVYLICIQSYSGKKTILYTTKYGENAKIMPIMGIDFEKLTINENHLLVWSIGGRSAYRPLWSRHYSKMSAFIFVVDSNDHQNIDEASKQLDQLTNDENFREKPVLIFANKRDLPNAMDIDQLRDKLHLEKLSKNIQWHLQAVSAIHNQGLQEGFHWLMTTIREKTDPTNPMVETFNDVVTIKDELISTLSIDKLTAFVRKFISLSFHYIESVTNLVNLKQTLFLK